MRSRRWTGLVFALLCAAELCRASALPATLAAVRVVAEVADPLRDRPILILAVFEFCLAAAYLALWKAAPDFRMFGGMGAYFALTGIDHSIDYFTAIRVTPFSRPSPP